MISYFLSSFISLFALINPLSALPIFITLTKNYNPDHRFNIVKKTSIYIFFICLISYFIGGYVLTFFGISINALKIAGGIIISRSGFLLLNAKHKKDIKGKIKKESIEKDDISFSPLAMPLLAGPGSMSLLINMRITDPFLNNMITMLFVILFITLAIFFILSVAPKIINFTGEAGLKSLSKIMGFLVLAIGIEMILGSIIELLKTF